MQESLYTLPSRLTLAYCRLSASKRPRGRKFRNFLEGFRFSSRRGPQFILAQADSFPLRSAPPPVLFFPISGS